jgi:hypothetical protein
MVPAERNEMAQAFLLDRLTSIRAARMLRKAAIVVFSMNLQAECII